MSDPVLSGPRIEERPLPAGGRLDDLLRLLDGKAGETAMPPGIAVPLWRVRSGATLLREGAPGTDLHVVRCGTFKCLRTLEDGYEQVLAFAGPAEVLGFEAWGGGPQPVSVVALEASSVYALPARELDAWRRRCPALDRALMAALGRQLARAGAMVEMMAAVAAEVRLARFLLWLSSRMAEQGQSPRRLLLRMSRRDIASLLGVAHETVSRSFGVLAQAAYLRVNNREIEILDPQGLKECAHNTRGCVDEMLRHVVRQAAAG